MFYDLAKRSNITIDEQISNVDKNAELFGQSRSARIAIVSDRSYRIKKKPNYKTSKQKKNNWETVMIVPVWFSIYNVGKALTNETRNISNFIDI